MFDVIVIGCGVIGGLILNIDANLHLRRHSIYDAIL